MRWEDIRKEPVGKGLLRSVVHGRNITLARFYLDTGAIVPEHSHDNEQISYVIEGRLAFEVGGEASRVMEGNIVMIPPGTLHKVTALEPSVILDTFSPPRKDWMENR